MEQYAISSPIRKQDITFVVSGKVCLHGDYNTKACLTSIRRFFPQSQIILSTWKSAEAEQLEAFCDQVLLLDEPENSGIYYMLDTSQDSRENSINKQQLSVSEGLKRVTTPYAVRMRTDFYLKNDHFLAFYLHWRSILTQADPIYRVFSERLLVYRVNMVDPKLYGGAFAYQLSDCFQFGLREDLQRLWDGHQECRDSLDYFRVHSDAPWENPHGFNHLFTAEQTLYLHALQQASISLRTPAYYYDHSDPQITVDNTRVNASNLLIGDDVQLGLASKFWDPAYTKHYTLESLLEDYLLHIDPQNRRLHLYLPLGRFRSRFNRIWRKFSRRFHAIQKKFYKF